MTQPASRHERVRRYYLPTIDGLEGWAEIIITDGGFFSTVSDYGNYAFAWRSFGECFRSFLLEAEKDVDYFTKKLQPGGDGPGDVYDGRTTVENIKRHIIECRREAIDDERRARRMRVTSRNAWTRDFARREWDLIDSCDVEANEGSFWEWCRETEISEAYEFSSHQRNPGTKAFVERVLAKRLCPILRAELDAERRSPHPSPEKGNP